MKACEVFVMLNKRLKELREEKLLTQAELAEKLNISRGSVGNYEKDERMPDGEVLVKFADFFGVSTDYLLGRSDFKSFGQEYDFFRNRLGLGSVPYSAFVNPHGKTTINLFGLNDLLVSIDENYSSIITEMLTGNEKFRKFALNSLDKLLKVITFTGNYLKEDIHDEDMLRYIEFLGKLKDTDLSTSDFGNIQANQEQIRGCTTCFNEFISFFAYSIIDFENRAYTEE